MDEPSRRALLGGVGTGLVGLLAGCRAPTVGRDPTPAPVTDATPEPTTTPTPEPEPEPPDFWEWLPATASVGGDYSFGSLALPDLRSAELARNRLAPTRFTPTEVHGILGPTAELLTLSTGSAAGGILRGDYDSGALGDELDSAGLTANGDGVYTGERRGFALDSTVVRWADDPDGPTGVLDVLGRQVDGDAEDSLPMDGPVRRALTAIRGASARFGRPLAVESGPFATARFVVNGIGVSDATVRWRSVVAFDGSVPDAAAERYGSQFVDREGFEDVVVRTGSSLLLVEAATTADVATQTEPL
jgi:hypothetical protein